MFDPDIRRRFGLDSLRFGDFVAIANAEHRYGRAYQRKWITVGIVVHSDSTVSGHGPGVVTLLTGPASVLRPYRNPAANLADDIRHPSPSGAQSLSTAGGQAAGTPEADGAE